MTVRRAAVAGPARALSHGALVLLSIVCVFPVLWMLASSLKGQADIASLTLIPHVPTLANYAAVFSELPILAMIANTVVMAAAVTLLQLATSVLAAYAFGRWRFRMDWLLYTLVIGTWLVPFQITMIPNYVVIAGLHWLNTLQALIVPQAASAFGVILLTQAVRAFPTALFVRPTWTAPGRGRPCGAWSCRICGRRSRPWPSCSSSAAGTNTSGRCLSRTGPRTPFFRSGCRCS